MAEAWAGRLPRDRGGGGGPWEAARCVAEVDVNPTSPTPHPLPQRATCASFQNSRGGLALERQQGSPGLEVARPQGQGALDMGKDRG